jgi:hypothetical protein
MARPTKAKHDANPLPVKIHDCTGLAMSDAKAEKVASAFLNGMSIRAICRAYGTSHQSVVSLIRNRPDLVERTREVTARNWRVLASVTTSELLSRVTEMKDGQLAILSGIATDKDALLSGMPTERVEVTIRPAVECWHDFVDSMRGSGDVIDVVAEPVVLAGGAA